MIGAVVGIGLVSPLGMTPTDHVFFRRAGLPHPRSSCFVDPDDEPVDVELCACLGGRVAIHDRMVWLARAASATALIQLRNADAPPPALVLCLPESRPGFGAAETGAVERAIVDTIKPKSTRVVHGAASPFVALPEAGAMLSEGKASSVLLLGVDSFVDVASLTGIRARPPSPWMPRPAPPSEGAAALALVTDTTARRLGIRVRGVVVDAAAAHGAANEDNDEPADGVALSVAIRAIASGDPIGILFGQSGVDVMRMYECQNATARTHTRFRPDCLFDCVEVDSGRTGAAAGVMHLAYGFGAVDHGAIPVRLQGAPFVAWAMSRDGTRGLALCRPGDL